MDPGMTPRGHASRSTITGEANTSDSESVNKDFESCHSTERVLENQARWHSLSGGTHSNMFQACDKSVSATSFERRSEVPGVQSSLICSEKIKPPLFAFDFLPLIYLSVISQNLH
jgi:hypothetical protein